MSNIEAIPPWILFLVLASASAKPVSWSFAAANFLALAAALASERRLFSDHTFMPAL